LMSRFRNLMQTSALNLPSKIIKRSVPRF